MTRGRIAVLGCGIVSAVGTGLDEFARRLEEAASGLGEASLFETGGLRVHLAGEIRAFDPHAHLEGKSLRGMSRSAHLACSAAALALPAAGEVAERVALVAGTAYGNLASMVRFDRESFHEGPRFVDATLFPNTVINSPAGFVSIFFRLTGPNSTLSEGVSSSLAAFDYAATLLERGTADEVLAGGFEELSQWLHLGLHNAGRLAGSRSNDAPRCVPFARTSTGIVPGEGAAFLRLAPGTATGTPLGWIAGRGEAFVPQGWDAGNVTNPAALRVAMRVAMESALTDAGVVADEIGAVWASANGDPALDAAEAAALGDVFGQRLVELPVVAIKGALGECFGASGAVQAASALAALRTGIAPPSLGWGGEPVHPALAGLRSQAQPFDAGAILVNAFNGRGCNRAMVLTATR